MMAQQSRQRNVQVRGNVHQEQPTVTDNKTTGIMQ